MEAIAPNRVPNKTRQVNSTEIVVFKPFEKEVWAASDFRLEALLGTGWKIARDSTGKAYAMLDESMTEGRA